MISTSNKNTFDPYEAGFTNIVEVVMKRAQLKPNKIVYRFLEDGEKETDSLTFKQLDTKARTVAYHLRQQGKPGDRILLLFPTGLEYITAFFGCLYAGMIAIPAYPPRRNRSLNRIRTIITDSGAKTSLISEKVAADIQRNFADDTVLKNINLIVYQRFDKENAEKWKKGNIEGDDIALLQYTSGSTGEPKGVMITHANIIYNSEYIRRSFSFNENLQGVNWLPIFHDMGLIGTIIQPAYVGGANVIMPSVAFLKNPLNWLKAIEKYNANDAGGPNFSYEYCLQKTTEEERAKLDLSKVETFFCGAEPIRKSTFDNFVNGLKSADVSHKQLYPCYGLAEGTLIVTGGYADANPKYLTVDTDNYSRNKINVIEENDSNGTSLVGCGHVWMETDVHIVTPDTKKEVEDGVIGEIWISGPTVAKGYWNNEEQTKQTFQAFISDTIEGPFLRTGDLGFFHKEELYITGRLKDMIIIRGVNHYPTDIEHTIQNCSSSLRQYGGAAIPVTVNGEEKLVIIQELERNALRLTDHDELIGNIRKAIAEEHELEVHAVVLIRTGSIPMTSSGKIQRRLCKYGYLNNELTVVTSWKQGSENDFVAVVETEEPTLENIKAWLTNWIVRNQYFHVDEIDPDKNIMAYGIDSLAAVTLETEISTHFGFQWHVSSFMLNPTINKLAEEGVALYQEEKN